MNLFGETGSKLTETGFDTFAKVLNQKVLRRVVRAFAVFAPRTLLPVFARFFEYVLRHLVRVARIRIEHAALWQVQG